jgi:hypothetical protein
MPPNVEQGVYHSILLSVYTLHRFLSARQPVVLSEDLPIGPRGREIPAQGRGRRPTPWDKGLPHHCGLKGRGKLARSPPTQGQRSRGPSGRTGVVNLSTQGVGLRPRPWAPFSRPVGPAGGFLTGPGYIIRDRPLIVGTFAPTPTVLDRSCCSESRAPHKARRHKAQRCNQCADRRP